MVNFNSIVLRLQGGLTDFMHNVQEKYWCALCSVSTNYVNVLCECMRMTLFFINIDLKSHMYTRSNRVIDYLLICNWITLVSWIWIIIMKINVSECYFCTRKIFVRIWSIIDKVLSAQMKLIKYRAITRG